ncbi:MAG: NAD-dependent succinate-semialdehyde dehydrogenase [Saprospiraceae bacterium]|nr:NAD-dependent succinate-semialdehyde dehydrogenase [Saprospiraceae bacterium]
MKKVLTKTTTIFNSIHPYDQSIVGEYAALTDAELKKKLTLSAKAYQYWRTTTFDHRANLMHRLAAILHRDNEKLAHLVTLEMGKIISESRAEVSKSAAHTAFYAEHTEGWLKDQIIKTEAHRSFVTFDPIGCIFAIMPWNFPIWQVMRYAAPTIMAGNVTILKHAPTVFGCAEAIEKAFLEAGFPEGIFQSIVIDIPSVDRVIAADIVQGVTLTGSEYAGSQVAALAGKYIKKSVLELGGSDAFIVLADADLDKAAKIATQSRMINAGQACNCAKRFIIVEAVFDAFLERFKHHVQQIKLGNPFDESNQMGSLARFDLAEKLENQVKISIQNGAVAVLGSERQGCLYEPTLLRGVKKGMVAFDEEMFGPVAAVISAKNEAEALTLANNHRYGLDASIWTTDLELAYRMARQLDVGNVFVNTLVRSDSRMPFGGVKKSGFGRELSEVGLKEWVNCKTVVMEA